MSPLRSLAAALALCSFASPVMADSSPQVEADEDHPGTLTGFYLRGDLGLNAPTGLAALTLGRHFKDAHFVEASTGVGDAAYFLSTTYRQRLLGDRFHLAAGVGGSVGLPNGGGYSMEEHSEPPTTTTGWLHGEVAVQRAGRGFTFVAAVGYELLAAGRYHLDFTDVQIVDRNAGSLEPYLRLGVGGEL